MRYASSLAKNWTLVPQQPLDLSFGMLLQLQPPILSNAPTVSSRCLVLEASASGKAVKPRPHQGLGILVFRILGVCPKR